MKKSVAIPIRGRERSLSCVHQDGSPKATSRFSFLRIGNSGSLPSASLPPSSTTCSLNQTPTMDDDTTKNAGLTSTRTTNHEDEKENFSIFSSPSSSPPLESSVGEGQPASSVSLFGHPSCSTSPFVSQSPSPLASSLTLRPTSTSTTTGATTATGSERPRSFHFSQTKPQQQQQPTATEKNFQHRANRTSTRMALSEHIEHFEFSNQEITLIVQRLQEMVRPRDVQYKNRIFEQCFSGREAVDHLLTILSQQHTMNFKKEAEQQQQLKRPKIERCQAVAFATELFSQGWLFHVTHQFTFRDESEAPYLYKVNNNFRRVSARNDLDTRSLADSMNMIDELKSLQKQFLLASKNSDHTTTPNKSNESNESSLIAFRRKATVMASSPSTSSTTLSSSPPISFKTSAIDLSTIPSRRRGDSAPQEPLRTHLYTSNTTTTTTTTTTPSTPSTPTSTNRSSIITNATNSVAATRELFEQIAAQSPSTTPSSPFSTTPTKLSSSPVTSSMTTWTTPLATSTTTTVTTTPSTTQPVAATETKVKKFRFNLSLSTPNKDKSSKLTSLSPSVSSKDNNTIASSLTKNNLYQNQISKHLQDLESPRYMKKKNNSDASLSSSLPSVTSLSITREKDAQVTHSLVNSAVNNNNNDTLSVMSQLQPTTPTTPTMSAASSATPSALGSNKATTGAKTTSAEPVHDALRHMLNNDKLRAKFKKFAQKEYSEENVIFYEEVLKYKQVKKQADREKLAIKMYKIFVPSESLYSLNLPASVSQELTATYTSGDTCVFDNAQYAIEICMRDTFKRFQMSEL